MRKLSCLFIVTFLCALSFEAHCQLNRKAIKKNNRRISHFRGKKSYFGKEKVYNALGFSLNALNYYGDLAPRPNAISTDISFTRPAIGLSLSHRFGPRYTLTAGFLYGTLRGADVESADPTDMKNGIFRYQRNLSFRNRIKELSLVASLDLFPNMATYISRVKWTPYLFLGLAVFHHNPQAQAPGFQLDGTPIPQAGNWIALRPLGTEGQYAPLQPGDANHGIKPYKLIQFAIPFGIGTRFRVNEVVDIAAELGFRYTFTDYLDDVSRDYVDLSVFGNNELAKAMSYRSNEIVVPNYPYSGKYGGTYNVYRGYGHENSPDSIEPFNKRGEKKDKDIYMVTTVRLTYILGKTFHRAKFR
jgi:hypothetical protein